MNKAILLGLSLALLGGCSSEPPVVTPEATVPDEVPTQEEEVVLDPVPEEDFQLPDEVEQAEIPHGDNPISNAYVAAIVAARDEESNMYNPIIIDPEDEFKQLVFPMLQFNPEHAQGFAISVSAMMVQAYGVVAILPVEGQEQVILDGMQYFIDTQIQNFTNYLPDQLDVAQSARLETLEDGTILLVMCADQDEVFDKIVTDGKILTGEEVLVLPLEEDEAASE